MDRMQALKTWIARTILMLANTEGFYFCAKWIASVWFPNEAAWKTDTLKSLTNGPLFDEWVGAAQREYHRLGGRVGTYMVVQWAKYVLGFWKMIEREPRAALEEARRIIEQYERAGYLRTEQYERYQQARGMLGAVDFTEFVRVLGAAKDHIKKMDGDPLSIGTLFWAAVDAEVVRGQAIRRRATARGEELAAAKAEAEAITQAEAKYQAYLDGGGKASRWEVRLASNEQYTNPLVDVPESHRESEQKRYAIPPLKKIHELWAMAEHQKRYAKVQSTARFYYQTLNEYEETEKSREQAKTVMNDAFSEMVAAYKAYRGGGGTATWRDFMRLAKAKSVEK